MNCFACEIGKATFLKNDDLIKHIAVTHKTIKFIHCCDNNCTRKFDSINSFRKHRQSKHSDITITNPKESVGTSIDNGISEFAGRDSPTNDSGPIDSPDHSVNDFDEIDSLNFQNDFNETTCPFAFSEIDRFIGSSKRRTGNFKDLVSKDAENFVSYCYSQSDINRKRTQEVVDHITRVFHGNAFYDLRNRLLNRLTQLGESADRITEFENDFLSLQNPFENLSSDFKIIKHFKNAGTLIMPEQVVIGEREEYKNTADGKTKELVKVKVTLEFIPLRAVLKNFFEMSGVFSETLQYIQDLNNDKIIVSNFIQGSFWKEKVSGFGDRIVLPLFLYYDDYETNDPLGSHSGISKCGAVYIGIPVLPIEFQSKKENIFLFFIFNSLDRKAYGNKIIFQRAIDELEFLQESGIIVKPIDKNIEVRIFFQLGPVLGDNLGLHGILGYAESFSKVNYPCRLCWVHKSEMNDIFDESQCKLRDKENYSIGLQENNVSSTGMKEECVLNALKGFHACDNICVDFMHDCLEGIIKSDVPKVLYHFIHDKNIISLDDLNERIIGFNYDINDKKSKPPPISIHHFNSKTLSMSASETLSFLRIFPLLIADKIVKGDEYWNLIIILRKIVELVMSKKVHRLAHKSLKVLIEDYLKLLRHLFPQDSLRPKHHYLVHYPRILERMGPIVKLSSMRYENKHRDGKSTANATASRVNICRTIALQNQFSLSYRFIRARERHAHSLFETAAIKSIKWEDIEDYQAFNSIINELGLTFCKEDLSFTKNVEFLGQQIEANSVIAVPNSTGYTFLKVQKVILEKNNKVLFLGQNISCFFNMHYDCYEVITSRTLKPKIFTLKEIYSNCFITYLCTFNAKLLCVNKWY